MRTLRAIDDHIELTQLLQRYCEALDQKAYDLLGQVFLPEARLSYSMVPDTEAPFVSLMEMVVAFREFNQAFFATQHLLGTPLIAIDDDTAASTTSLRAVHVQRRRNGESSLWTVYGTYRDRHVRTGVGWRIGERVFRAMYMDGELLSAEQVEKFEKPPWCWR